MFCRFCGKSIGDDSFFCQYCGNKLSEEKVKSDTQIQTKSTKELTKIRNLEREGISIYINQILHLEFILSDLRNKIDEKQQEIESKKECIGWKAYPHKGLYAYSENRIRYRNGNYWFDISQTDAAFGFHYKDGAIRTILYADYPSAPYPQSYMWWDISKKENYDYFSKDLVERVKKRQLFYTAEYDEPSVCIWRSVANPIIFGQEIFGSERAVFRDAAQARKYWIDDYQDFLKNKDNIIVTQNREIAELEKSILDFENDIERAQNILSKLYSANLIPSQYRGIESVYYICDYFNSSSESLSNILFHLDLDQIKAKFEMVFENQRQIIINQAVLIAQNDDIIRQNEECLRSLDEFSKNTSRQLADIEGAVSSTANWAQIAANNAEACAWIAAADYLFK